MTTCPHLGQLLQAAATKYAHCESLSIKDDSWSYQQLHEFAALLARGFALSKGQYCALLRTRHIGTLSGVIAALCYGKTYLPLNEEDPAERLGLLARSTSFDLLVTREQERALLQTLLAQSELLLVIILTDCQSTPDWSYDYPQHRFLGTDDIAELHAVEPRSYNPHAYLMFTSGSSGMPNGVEVSHANVVRYVENTVSLYEPNHNDRFSRLAPLSFDFSVHNMFVPWAVGASINVFNSSHSMAMGRLIDEKRLTFWSSVPSAALWLKRLRQLTSGHFRICGSRCSAVNPCCMGLQKAGRRLHHTRVSTTFMVAPKPLSRYAVSAGKVIPLRLQAQ